MLKECLVQNVFKPVIKLDENVRTGKYKGLETWTKMPSKNREEIKLKHNKKGERQYIIFGFFSKIITVSILRFSKPQWNRRRQVFVRTQIGVTDYGIDDQHRLGERLPVFPRWLGLNGIDLQSH